MKRGNPEFTVMLLGMKNALSRWGVRLGLLERLPSLPPQGSLWEEEASGQEAKRK